MATLLDLDVDSVARAGLIFLDGDSLEDILLDAYGHTDYNFDLFNNCKITIMKIERINPGLKLTAFLWQARPDNPRMAVPVVAGNALPLTGYGAVEISPALAAALDGTFGTTAQYPSGARSHYYPVRNSDGEIAGALELLAGNQTVVDI